MSLPFLKKDKVGSLMYHKKKPDGSIEYDDSDNEAGLHAAFTSIMRAINNGDIKAGAQALKEFFQIVDSEPHEEGEHANDFDSLNEKAAQKIKE